MDLSGNSIHLLANGSFTSAMALNRLDLSNNQLSRIEINAFEMLKNLRTLIMSKNQLDGEYIDRDTYEDIVR